MVRVATAGIEYQRTSFIKEAFDFRFLKRVMEIRRAIGYRLARQFPNTSSIFDHYRGKEERRRRKEKGERRGLGG